MDEIHLWQWRFIDEFGKRRVTSWRMTEETVREFAHGYKNAVKVEGSDPTTSGGKRAELSVSSNIEMNKVYWIVFSAYV